MERALKQSGWRGAAGKKASGIKRHIGVDTQGLPHAIAVTTAEVTDDRKEALQARGRCKARPDLGRVTLAMPKKILPVVWQYVNLLGHCAFPDPIDVEALLANIFYV